MEAATAVTREPRLEAVAHPPESAVEGAMRNMGETIASINKLGDEAVVLFRRLLSQREELSKEFDVQIAGGLSPHMEAALRAFQDHDAKSRDRASGL